MSRYKGRPSTKAIEREYPHIVEMAVPEGGFGPRLDAMHDWHHKRGLQSREGRGRYEEPTHYIRWCFAKREDAEAFQIAFGGRLLPPPPMPDDP